MSCARRLALRASLAWWALAGALPAAAVEPGLSLSELVRSQWRAEEGLPQDAVTAVKQTRDGFLWIGTRAGLARFDGAQFTVYGRHELPLRRTINIQTLAEDGDGQLWIGTDGGELLRYQAGVFRLFSDADGLSARRISKLAATPGGVLWIGTYGDGLFRFEGGRFERIALVGSPQITYLSPDGAGGLWIGTYGAGVSHLRDDRLVRVTTAEGLIDDRVWWVLPTRDDALWIATDSGLCRWQAGKCQVWGPAEGLSQRQTISLHEDRHGVLWIGTHGGGIHRLHPDGRLESLDPHEDGSDDNVWTIYEDREGMVWLGTTNNGLRLLTDGAFASWRDQRGGLESRLVTVLEEGEAGTIFVGTRDAGLLVRRRGEFRRLGLEQGLETVWSLAWDGQGLWIGSGRGLFRLVGERLEPFPLPGFEHPPTVSALLPTREALWVGTNRGLLRLAGTGRRFFDAEDGLPSNSIRDLLVDRRGRLWIATLGGLAMLDGDVFRNFDARDGLPGTNVVSLYEDPEGAIWLALAAGGLARVVDGQIAALTARDGLVEDDLTAIVADGQGFLWLGTSRGIVRVAHSALVAKLADPAQTLPQTLFDRLDGVDPGGVWASGHSGLAAEDGHLYFATLSGVAIYDPRSPRHRVGTPRAVVDSVEADGRRIALDRPASLPNGVRELVFHFAAPLPHAGAKIRMRHRLTGVDRDWIEDGSERQAIYSGLPPGDYAFEVQASTSAGQFVSSPISYRFQVAAGRLQGWRLPLALIAGVAGLIYAYHRARVFQLQRRERRLASRIEDARAELHLLNDLLPLCGTCLKVRDDEGFWQQVESYLARHTAAEFTHGLCPDCAAGVLAELDESR